MKKKFLFLFIIILYSCSFDNKSGIWKNESLTSKDFEKFVKYFELMPHVRGIANFTCSNCGHVNEHEIRGMQNFF